VVIVISDHDFDSDSDGCREILNVHWGNLGKSGGSGSGGLGTFGIWKGGEGEIVFKQVKTNEAKTDARDGSR
jgi:hypothetical protein